MKSLMKLALLGLFAISTATYASEKPRKKGKKKPKVTMNCPVTCDMSGCSKSKTVTICPESCPKTGCSKQ